MQAFRVRPAAIGRSRAKHLAARFGSELRVARMNAGLTQRGMARLAGVSQPEASKAERGLTDVSLDARSRLAAACGHEIGWRLYPTTTIRLRDSGQMALAQTIVSAAHSRWRPQLELPIGPDDKRAADLVLIGAEEIIHIEIERALVDFQAQLRAAQLKRGALAERNTGSVRLVVAVPDTRTTRSRLAPFADLIARTLPAPSAKTWRAIRSGEPLGEDGILLVRAPCRG